MARKRQPDRDQEPAATSGFRIESILSIDERGQMVLPKDVRERAGIGPGDKLALLVWEREGAAHCLSLIKAEKLTSVVKDILGPMTSDLSHSALAEPVIADPTEQDSNVRKPIQKVHDLPASDISPVQTRSYSVSQPSPASSDILGTIVTYADESFEPSADEEEEEEVRLDASNPTDWTVITQGQVVLDLGSGVGFDCFLAAARVGPTGRVIGIDMTSDMIDAARANALKGGYENVEFRLGELENLPVEDDFVDLVISNCAINLSSDKGRVFREAFRVLKPGGRLTVADIVLVKELPAAARGGTSAYAGCVAGALLKQDYIAAIRQAGFENVDIAQEASFAIEYLTNDAMVQSLLADERDVDEEDLRDLATSIQTLRVSAVKPLPRNL